MILKRFYRIALPALTALSVLCILSQCDNPADSKTKPKPTIVLSGKLQLEILGLSPLLSADIKVTGPNNYAQSFTQSVTIDSLPVGEYTIDATPVVDSNGLTVNVNPTSQKVTIVNQKTAKAQVFYQAVALGSLKITCSGLPPNSAYDIVVVSDFDTSISFVLNQTTQLDSLKVGAYTVTAKKVTGSDGKKYKSKTITVTAIVIKANLSEVGVEYELAFGWLSITITGLPFGLAPIVQVKGPTNTWDVQESVVLDSLDNGDYLVDAQEVTDLDGTVYKPVPGTQVIVVGYDEVSYVSIEYIEKYGNLDMTIVGLPPGLNADVTIFELLGDIHTIYSSTVLKLEENLYKIVAKEVVDISEGTTYTPSPDISFVDIVGGETKYAKIRYTSKYGILALKVTGLPSSVFGNVTLKNADQSSMWNMTGTDTINSLEPGQYTLIAEKVLDNSGDTLYPKPNSQNVVISAGDTTKATVEYTRGFDVFVYYGPNSPIAINGYGGGARVLLFADTTFDTLSDYMWVFDTSSFEPSPSCEIQNLDFTNSSISNSISVSAGGASSYSNALLVSSQANNRITITTEGNAIAPSIPSNSGSGSASSTVGRGSSWPVFALVINNPFRDTLAVTVTWTLTGSAQSNSAGTSSSNWAALTYIYKDFNPCAASATPEVIFNAYYDFWDGVMGEVAGSYTYLVTKDFENVGFEFYAMVGANSYKGSDPRQGHYGVIDESSQSSLTSTVTITVKQKQ